MKTFLALIAVLFLIHFEFGCKRKTDAQFILSKYKTSDTFHNAKNLRPDTIFYNKGYEAYLKYDRNGDLYKVYGKIDFDTSDYYGHFFTFDTLPRTANNSEYGRLISYMYLGSRWSPYSYAVKLNFSTEKYTEVFTPFLDYFIYTFSDKDSVLKYTLNFSGFPRSTIKASYSYDNNNYKDLAVSKSNFMPFLEQVDLRINRNVDHIFLKTEAKDLELDLPGLSNTRTFFDTVKLYKAVMSPL
jgi:hypothetical protein